MTMPHINIHDGTTHTLDNPTLPLFVQTFEMVFQQYHRHPESKSSAPDGTPCKADSAGLLKRYPVTATGFHLIGKETERGWEQNDDISTLMPSLVRYGLNSGIAEERLRHRLQQIPLAFLERETRFRCLRPDDPAAVVEFRHQGQNESFLIVGSVPDEYRFPRCGLASGARQDLPA